MDTSGPNPKLISQGVILLGGLIVFMTIILYLKIRTGETIQTLISENQRLLIISLLISFAIISLIFLVLLLFNDWGEKKCSLKRGRIQNFGSSFGSGFLDFPP